MAREEHRREDLIGEATALVRRVELVLPECGHVVVGFRSNAAASVFFEDDPAYHFDSSGALRRAFVDGCLFKAENRRLAALDRQRTVQAVQLLRHDLNESESRAFLGELLGRLKKLRDALAAGQFQVANQVPSGDDLVHVVREWLAALPTEIPLALSPHAR